MAEPINAKLSKKDIISDFITDILAVIFWAYTLTKLFIYDLDIYLINHFFPNFAWIVEFKFLIILGCLSAFWLITKNKTVIFFLIYVLCFPFIIFLWKIPKLIIKSKSWVAAFTFISMTISFFTSLKANVISLTLFLIPAILAWRCHNQITLWISICLISFFIILLLARAIYFAFKPSLAFRIQSKVVSKFSNSFKSLWLPAQEVKDLAIQEMNEKQLQTWSANLQNAVIINRTCYFLATKLRDFQRSKINVFFYLTNFIFIVLLTIFSFSILNYAIYKVDHSAFSSTFIPHFFSFIFYSTNTLFTNGMPDFYPISTISRAVSTFEVIFAFVLLGILFFLFTTLLTDRHNEDIEFAINSMREQGDQINNVIKEHYRLTVDEAIKELERIKAAFMKAILYLSANINK